jgi:hypothetical protein
MRIIHSGHIGDILAFLPTYKKLGGTKLVVTDHDPSWPPMSGFRYESLKPLLTHLGVDSEFSTDPVGDFDNRDFRSIYDSQVSLLVTQAKYCKVEPDESPWIHAEPSQKTKGRVLVSRSARYHNYNFPWKRVMRHLGDRAVFMGTLEEHLAFQKDARCSVEYLPTPDLLCAAEAISGSDLYIHNQSCGFWIAAGMRHPQIQETSDVHNDTFLDYPGARYIRNEYFDISSL